MTIAYTSGTAIATMLSMSTAAGTSMTILNGIATDVNAWMENKMGRAVGVIGTATRTYDGPGGRTLFIRDGIQSAGTVTVYDGTRGAATTLGTADYYLDPPEPERRPGEPAWYITISDNPTGTYTQFPRGKRTVEVTGVWGWSATPAELAALATRLGVATWRGRASAGGDTFTVGVNGEKTYERFLSYEDRKTLERYSIDTPGIG